MQQVIITILTSLIASSGLWTLLSNRINQKNDIKQLLIGISHEMIIDRGLYYIDRGYITDQEFNDFQMYLYDPYKKLGGNGSAEIIFEKIKKLEIKKKKE